MREIERENGTVVDLLRVTPVNLEHYSLSL